MTFKKLYSIVLFLSEIFFCDYVFAQAPGCPAVFAGNDQDLTCSSGCTNLTATVFQSGKTSSYAVSSISYSPPSAFNVGTQLFIGIDDIWSDIINLPFNFCFYQNMFNQLAVGTNGLITFDLSLANNYCDYDFSANCPTPGPPPSGLNDNSIMGAYHDLDPSMGGEIRHLVIGSAPCRMFILNFFDVPQYNCSFDRTTQQIVLYETTNAIEVYIESKPTCSNGANPNAVIGIQNSNGTLGISPSGRNTGIWAAGNEAWRFTPDGPPNFSLRWFDDQNNFIDTGLTLNVCPTDTITYTAQATYSHCDGSQIIVTDTVTVNVSGVFTTSTSFIAESCAGNDGKATVIPTSEASPYSYQWNTSPIQTTGTATGLTGGPYIVTVTGTGGCIIIDTVTVPLFSPPFANAGNDSALCIGNSLQIGGSPTGPAGSSYSWLPSGTLDNSTLANPTATPTGNTTYIVTITDTNGCFVSDTVDISIFTLPVSLASNDTAICNGDTIQLTSSGGINFNWSPAAGLSAANISNPLAFPSANTTYTVTVTDANSCNDTETVVISLFILPEVDAGNDTAICVGDTIQTGGSPTSATGINFGWSPATNLSNTAVANPDAFPVSTITYTVVVSDANTCFNTDSIVVSVNNLPIVDAGNDTSICIGNSVQIGGSPTGPPGSDFNWLPSGTLNNSGLANPAATTSSNTDYVVTVTDANSCVNSDTVTVSLFSAVTATASNDTVICNGDTVPLIASGGVSYNWSPSTGLSAINIANPLAFPSVNTTYTVTVTDVNSCNDTETVVISLFNLPEVDAGNDTSICIGDTVQPGGSPTSATGINFSWSPATNLSNPAVANPDAFPVSTITYTVVVSDANTCSNSDSIVVAVNNLPIVDAGDDTTICDGVPVVTGGSPTGPLNSNFSWSPATSLSGTTTSNPIATPSSNITYTVTVTDTNSCVNTDDVSFVVNANPVSDAGPGGTLCVGDSLQLSGSGGGSYSWSPADSLTDPNISNPIAFPADTTIYYLIVTDGNNCKDTDSVTVNINQLPPADAGPDLWVCPSDSIMITATGGVIYSWTPSTGLNATNISNPKASPADTTKYFVTVTDVNGCINIDSMKLDVGTIVPTDAGPDTAICIGDTIQIGGNPTAPPGSTLSWNTSAGLSDTAVANPLAFTTDTITYYVSTTNYVCNGMDSVTLIVNLLPVAGAGTDVPVCIFDSTQLNATGGISYVWTPVGSLSDDSIANPFAYPTDTTEYFVTVIDVNGCENIDSVTVIVNPLPTVVISNDVEICIGDSTQLSASGGVDFAWLPADSLTDDSIFNPIAFPSDTTNYVVTVTDGNGCVNSDSVIITVSPLPVITLSSDVSICIGDTTQLIATGGNTYSWLPVDSLSNSNVSNPFAFPSDTTTYVVTVADSNSCVNKDSVIVTVNPLPNVDAGPDVAICIFDSTQLNASGGLSYAWIPADSLNDDSIPNPFAFSTDTTEYFVTAIDINGCINIDSITVIVNPLPAIIISNNVEICIGDSTQLSASGGVNNVWFPADSLTDDSISNPVAFPSDTTTYVVTVTDGNGCVNKDSVTVMVNPLPTISITGNLIICFGDTTQLIASGGDNYSWLPADSLNNPNIQNPLAFPSDITTYTVTVIDSNACVNSDSATIIINPLPNVDAGLNDTICVFDSTQLNASGGISYVWTPSDSLSDDSIPNPIAFASDITLYFVTATDINGCINFDSVEVIVNSLPTIIISNDLEICIGDSTQLSASGGVNNVWFPADSLTDDSISNPVAFPADTTNYVVTVTDGNGCVNKDSVTVMVNPLPTISITGNLIICFGDTTQLIASGGDNYSWLPADSLNNPNIQNPLAFPSDTTTYTVTVIDSNACVNSDSATIIVNPLPNVDAGLNDSVCFKDSVQLLATGGNTYLWQPGTGLSDATIPNPMVSPAVSTMYYATITDSNSCSDIDSVLITVNPLPDADAGVDTIACNGDSVQLSATGGITYLWDPSTGLNNVNISNPIASISGTVEYFVSVTDSNSCSNIDSITVGIFNSPAIDAGMNDTICSGDTIQLIAVSSVANTYSWNPSNNLSDATVFNPFAFPTSTILYFVSATDVNGCEGVDSVLVTVNNLPFLNAGNDTNICLNDTIQIILTLDFDGVYSWLPPIGLSDAAIPNPFAFPLVTTKYIITKTDSNNCSGVDSITVIVNSLPNADAGNDTSGCPGANMQLNASGGTNYLWSPPMGLNNPIIANPIATLPGDSIKYFVTITDANGCKGFDSVIIKTFSISVIPDTSICIGDSATLLVNAASGYLPYTYLWSPSTGLNNAIIAAPNAAPDASIVYSVKVTENSGCSDSADINIIVNENPIADFTFRLEPSCLGSVAEFENKSQYADSYLWIFGDNKTSAKENPEHQFLYNQMMEVTLVATNASGCDDSSSLTQSVKSFEDYFNIVFPNIFTPDGDGKNDRFEIRFDNKLQECTDVKIFNRWGEMIFASSGNQHSWSGRTFSGEEAPNGTYFFVFDINGKEFKGAVMLVR